MKAPYVINLKFNLYKTCFFCNSARYPRPYERRQFDFPSLSLKPSPAVFATTAPRWIFRSWERKGSSKGDKSTALAPSGQTTPHAGPVRCLWDCPHVLFACPRDLVLVAVAEVVVVVMVVLASVVCARLRWLRCRCSPWWRCFFVVAFCCCCCCCCCCCLSSPSVACYHKRLMNLYLQIGICLQKHDNCVSSVDIMVCNTQRGTEREVRMS